MGWQSKVDANYHKAKLFVLPSVYEGLGNVLIDAINHSVPCIATNCKSGPKEILDNGKGGYIVPVKNISALSDKMIFAIKNKKITQEKVKFSKKRLFRFNSETQSKKYLNYLNSIL